MKVHVVFSVCCYLVTLLELVSTQECLLDQDTEKLRIAFVLDLTATNREFMDYVFPDVFGKLLVSLNNIHPGTEIALTGFANWPTNAFAKGSWSHKNEDPEKCYMRMQAFTADASLLKSSLAKKPDVVGRWDGAGKEENSISAVSFTLRDGKLGWVNGSHDADGKRIQRFVLLLTDQWTNWELTYPEGRRPFRGDGSDTCSTSLPVTQQQAAHILVGSDVKVIGIYTRESTKYVQNYEWFFNKHAIPHCYTVLKAYHSGYDNQKAHNEILETILRCVKTQLKCDFYDTPPAYNMLGL